VQGAQPLVWSERFLQALKGRNSFETKSLDRLVGVASSGFPKELFRIVTPPLQNFGKESFFMFFLVLIQERTKENQG